MNKMMTLFGFPLIIKEYQLCIIFMKMVVVDN